MLDVNGRHLARHEIEAWQLFAEIFVVDLHDMVAQCGEGHRVRIGRRRFGNSIECRQHRDDGRGIESLRRADFGQRFFSAAAIVDAETLKDPGAVGLGADDFADGGLGVE